MDLHRRAYSLESAITQSTVALSRTTPGLFTTRAPTMACTRGLASRMPVVGDSVRGEADPVLTSHSMQATRCARNLNGSSQMQFVGGSKAPDRHLSWDQLLAVGEALFAML